MSILAGYWCHTSVYRKSRRPRRGGNSTVGIRGSGEPGEDGGYDVCCAWQVVLQCVVYIYVVAVSFGTWSSLGTLSELVCCGLKKR